MAIINNLNGNDGVALNFIMECMDKINAEADVKELVEVEVNYLKTFIDSFEKKEIEPILTRANKVYNAQINNRPIDITSLKAQNTTNATNGTRTPEVVESELPKWPICFKNPIKIASIFGSVPNTAKKRKGISVLTSSKLLAKINLLNSIDDTLYLIEYFLKFFFTKKEKEYYREYDLFLNKLQELGFFPKDRNSCFTLKNKDGIANDIVSLFLAEDFNIEENKEYLLKCIDRYYELFS